MKTKKQTNKKNYSDTQNTESTERQRLKNLEAYRGEKKALSSKE